MLFFTYSEMFFTFNNNKNIYTPNSEIVTTLSATLYV